jgi:ATP-dependent helicase HrpB
MEWIPMLPVINYRSQILSALASGGSLIVAAPPGTGKSTQIPQFFADQSAFRKKLLVLEPRRIAARALAFRVSEELGVACGEKVGYQVRFERRASPDTGILFLTYGVFLQMLGSDPMASDASIVVFDEFHERSLDADAALAWVRRLSSTVRPDLKFMVLSATLATEELREYLDECAIISVPDRLFHVDVRYQPPKPAEPLDGQVLRALADITVEGAGGSAIAFLPGSHEIERAAERIHSLCKRRGFRVMRLHGRMPLSLQQEALRRPALEPCVILSTNVAETSLTIPGVTVVIDSGLARVAGYDAGRERNTLYLGRISVQNAVQRAGRAGRLGPGVCVRLWSRADEAAMPPAIVPEVRRLDLAGTMLALCNLQKMVNGASGADNAREKPAIRFLTPPSVKRWEKAAEELVRCEAIESCDTGGPPESDAPDTPLYPLTKFGAAMSRLPLAPAIAAVLLKSRSLPVRRINIAMAALWESGESKLTESRDLFDEASDFSAGPSQRYGAEVRDACTQIERLLGRQKANSAEVPLETQTLRREATQPWLRVFSHRLGVRMGQGMVYELADGRSARLIPAKSAGAPILPELILALSVHEQAGRETAKKAVIPLYLSLEPAWIADEFGGELGKSVECAWDEAKQAVRIEEITRFRGIPLRRREVGNRADHRAEAAAVLAEHIEGSLDWRRESKAEQFVLRVRLVAAAFPDKKIPRFTEENWRLICHALCEGKYSLAEVRKGSILHAFKSYLGPALTHFIERKAPEQVILPSGKRGRVTYLADAPPELSARIGDLIGYPDRFTVADGRVNGVFDILAPNYRTVQKTPDLGSFWKNTYPLIKRELQRKYPKHPWP